VSVLFLGLTPFISFMVKKNESKGWPYLVGLDHDNPSKEIRSKLNIFINNHVRKGSTFFIEKDPLFLEIAGSAKAKGAKIVVLDRESIFKLSRKIKWKDLGSAMSTMLYLTYTVRERAWNNTLKSQAKKGDIVLAHPAHIDGLVENHSFPKEKIILKQDYPKTTPRLSPEVIKQIQAFRRAERKKRQRKIKRKKIISFLPDLLKKIKLK
jgi:hypothetical protein